MLKKALLVAGVAIFVAGCGSSSSSTGNGTDLKPKHSQPTGDLEKLGEDLDKGNTNLKALMSLIEQSGKSIKKTGFEPDKLSPKKSSSMSSLSSISNSDKRPGCIDDSTITSQSETKATANGKVKFNNCKDIDGIDADGSINIDYTDIYENSKTNIDYKLTIDNFSISDSNASILVKIAKIKGSIKETRSEEEYGGKGTAKASIGISAIAKEGKKIVLELDGFNVKSNAEWNNDQNSSSYETKVNGYIGNEDLGMFKVTTVKTIENNNKNGNLLGRCPVGGKIKIVGKGNKSAIVEFRGKTFVITGDDKKKKRYDCKN